MSAKKKLPRVSSRVPDSFKQRVEDLKTLLQRKRRWFYNGEKLSEEGIVAAALMEFMSLDESSREAVLDRHLPAIEAMFEDMKDEGPAEREAGPGENLVSETERLVPPRRRKNKGA